MAGFLDRFGETLSKIGQSVGKALEQAAPILLPIAATTIGAPWLAGLGKVGGLVGQFASSGVGSQILSKVVPALVTNAIMGKKKSPEQAAKDMYNASPGSARMAKYGEMLDGSTGMFQDRAQNPKQLEAQKLGGPTPVTMGGSQQAMQGTGAPTDVGVAMAPVTPPYQFQQDEEARRRRIQGGQR